MRLPKLTEIDLRVEREPIPVIKVFASGLLLGLVRKLSGGYTFTSDEIGSFLLPEKTHTDDIPKLVLEFITDNAPKWIAANDINQDSIDCACDELGSQCDVCDDEY